MGLFDKIKEPIVYKDSTNIQKQIEELKKLGSTEDIEKDIKLLECGLYGENKVLYELKNSHIGMYILQDIYVEYKGLNAQVDFVIITHKNIYYIECKNLVGDIEIDHNGNFIRTFKYDNHIYKEGIYNPITQNQRHLELFRQIQVDNVGFLRKNLVGNYFYTWHVPVVVLANDKSILNDKYAPQDVKNKVIKVDKLIDYIRQIENNSQDNLNDKEMLEFAESYKSMNVVKQSSIVDKYNNTKVIDKNKLRQELREYRYHKAQENGDKPYFVFNDNTLDDLITKLPLNREDLDKVIGFGTNKIDKYGDDIINIIKKYV
jgi:hypothetical protein